MDFYIIPDRNNGYPCIPQLPEMAESAGMTAPFPEYAMYCIDSLNDGYPCIIKLHDLIEKSFSAIYLRNIKIRKMYLNNIPVKAAYINNISVFTRK